MAGRALPGPPAGEPARLGAARPARVVRPRPAGVDSSLQQALAIYRLLVLGYAGLVIAAHWQAYARPWAGWVVFAGMAAWSAVRLVLVPRPAPGWLDPVLLADLAVTCAALVATRWVQTPGQIEAGAPTVPTFWASAAVVAWGVGLGTRGGLIGAAALTVANEFVHFGVDGDIPASIFLLFVTGLVVGYVSSLARRAEAVRTAAARAAAATAERERLARDIHDSVLQVLALVSRRGVEIGGEPAELGRLAGEQERILRALVAGTTSTVDGLGDLGQAVRAEVARRPGVTLAAPAGPVPVDGAVARELAAAVGAALDNVTRHAGDGAQAFVLVEDDAGMVTVTVRDDGAGMAPDRLAAAAGEGRLGVAQSIVGRLRALGGDAVITTAPGQGTEVELRLPRDAA
jgi:signal transduction histidine kinase